MRNAKGDVNWAKCMGNQTAVAKTFKEDADLGTVLLTSMAILAALK